MVNACSHSDMLVIDLCFGLDPAVSSKPKWLGTRSPISMNLPASIFSTRFDGTGGIVELAIRGADSWLVGRGAFFHFDESTLTCS